jgi:AbrB family looped-hinge helix DNA binding protein
MIRRSKLILPDGRSVASMPTLVDMQKFCNTENMKATLTISERGVITLPAKLRQALGLSANDQLIAETTSDGLLLRLAVTLPVEIYSDERLREFDESEAELAVVLENKSH